MAERLDAIDVGILYTEEPTTPTHVGSVGLFEPPSDHFGYETVLNLVRERLALVPRYRQRIRWVPGHLANPVWVDDADFDLSFHVRRSAVPKPGTTQQLWELVGHVFSRPLDRGRPLWELYVVEGLAHGRLAIVSKTHQAVIDGIVTVDIGQVILDDHPDSVAVDTDGWQPRAEPSSFDLLGDAVVDVARRPTALLDSVRRGAADARRVARRVVGGLGDLGDLGGSAAGLPDKVASTVGDVADAVAQAVRPAPVSPLNVPIGAQRRYVTADTALQDYRRVRAAHSGSVNDVILATIAGAFRAWFMTRGVPVRASTSVRAMVPLSVRADGADGADDDGAEGSVAGPGVGGRVAAYVIDLPVGEPSPVMRLHQVSYAMAAHHEGGRAVAASTLVGLTGFAPPTLHALGARVAGSLSRRLANVVVTNVPGPQTPLFAGPARMVSTYPVVPLAKGQALAIGLTSYDGAVRFGLTGDRDAMADIDVLAQCLPDAIAELMATIESGRVRPDT